MQDFSEDEQIGWEQVCRLFQKRKVFVVHPKSLDTGLLQSYVDQHHGNSRLVAVDDQYFNRDRSGYSRMLTSLWFYELFADFNYMLIHQLDAFVFRDELDYWMQKNYDYIGAPIIYEHCNSVIELQQKAIVGNGGLSLRKTATFIKLLQLNPVIRSTERLLKEYLEKYKTRPVNLMLRILMLPAMALGFRNRMQYFSLNYNVHEDYFWCDYVAKKIKGFHVASLQDAALFSLDGFPSQVANLLNIGLPMGCHAWKRYDPVFWQPYINKGIDV